MSFSATYDTLPMDDLLNRATSASESEVLKSLRQPKLDLAGFASLLSPVASQHLELMSRLSQSLTRRRFGRVIRLFAPLYLSNECINNCRYCGFSRDNPILRVTLAAEEVLAEALELRQQGFRNVLLVSGEHPKFVDNGYLETCIRTVHRHIPSVSLEVGPMESEAYKPMTAAGAEGLVVYQETYDRETYGDVHTAGPKKDFYWRLETPERAYAAGFRRLGIGALYGLSDWRKEAICLAAHTAHLLKHCWKAQVTISFPRLRPCAGAFEPKTKIKDLELVQLICSFRLMFPDVGLVLSTREPAKIRDGLIPLGITLISAGSHTEPGGYTGAGKEKIHVTVRGRIEALSEGSTEWGEGDKKATGQFNIADERSPESMAEQIRRVGYEPVWKDWDQSLSLR